MWQKWKQRLIQDPDCNKFTSNYGVEIDAIRTLTEEKGIGKHTLDDN